MRTKRSVLYTLLFCTVSLPSIAQELKATVTVNNLEQIPSTYRDYLRDFKTDIEKYLNGTKYTDEDMLGDRIQCSFDIYFKSANSENNYTVQVFVGSQRTVYANDEKTDRTSPILRVLDDKWQFTYQPGQRMRQDDYSFDPLTDFLDFYAYIIIGMDLETYTPRTGSKWFQKAFNICEQGASGETASEWTYASSPYNRYAFAEELTNPKYTLAREAFTSYHFDGIDLLSTQPRTALDNMLRAIEQIASVRKTQNPSSVFVRQFFSAKNREIADAFSQYGDPSVYQKLGEYDQEHLSVYMERRNQ